jgi:hypothetical protein
MKEVSRLERCDGLLLYFYGEPIYTQKHNHIQ